MTLQAKMLKDALLAIGLRHGSWRSDGDYTVETLTKRVRSRSTGLRYSEYGDAIAHLQNREAAKVVEHNARLLAEQGLHVILVYAESDGHLIDAIVSTRSNPQHEVAELHGGEWKYT